MSVKTKLLLLILLLSAIPFISIFTTHLAPHTSDGEVQMPRMVAYYQAVQDGHIPVRWAGNLNYGYGMPLFIFIYHTPFLISSVLLSLGVSVVFSFKLLLLLSFLLSGITMFLFADEFFEDQNIVFVVTLLYQFAPFHLTEILVRGSLGGIYAYAFFPLVLLGLTRLTKKFSLQTIALIGIATALMIISHNALSLLFFGSSVLFVIFFARNKSLITCFLSLVTGLLLSAWFWIPALVERKFTYGDLFMQDLYTQHFPHILSFIIPRIFDTQELTQSFISPHIGFVQTAVLGLALYLLFQKKTNLPLKKTILYGLFLFLGAMLFMTPVTLPLWKSISLLRQFQFPWRFLAVVVFATSFLGGVLSRSAVVKKQSFLVALTALIILPTFSYWTPPQGWDAVDEQAIWDYPLNTTYFGETDVIWSEGPAKSYPDNRVEIIAGEATINDFSRSTVSQTFTVIAQDGAQLVSHTQYFPGWRVLVDGKKTAIEFQDQNHRGEITFAVPSGRHDVRLIFGESKIRLISNVISLATGILLLLILVFTNKVKESISKRSLFY